MRNVTNNLWLEFVCEKTVGEGSESYLATHKTMRRERERDILTIKTNKSPKCFWLDFM